MSESRFDNVVRDLLPFTSFVNDALNAARSEDRQETIKALGFVFLQVQALCITFSDFCDCAGSPCEHQYLPDEDGTVYTCGNRDDTINVNGEWLCPNHR